MAIKTNNDANGVLILITDTTLLTSSASERRAVTFASLHEQTGAAETVELFISTDSSSAAGERLDIINFAPNDTKNPLSMLITIPAGSFLIGKGTTGSLVECNISYTLYNGDD